MVTLTAATASSRPRDPQLIIKVRTPMRHTLKDRQMHIFKVNISAYQHDIHNTVLTDTDLKFREDLTHPTATPFERCEVTLHTQSEFPWSCVSGRRVPGDRWEHQTAAGQGTPTTCKHTDTEQRFIHSASPRSVFSSRVVVCVQTTHNPYLHTPAVLHSCSLSHACDNLQELLTLEGLWRPI